MSESNNNGTNEWTIPVCRHIYTLTFCNASYGCCGCCWSLLSVAVVAVVVDDVDSSIRKWIITTEKLIHPFASVVLRFIFSLSCFLSLTMALFMYRCRCFIIFFFIHYSKIPHFFNSNRISLSKWLKSMSPYLCLCFCFCFFVVFVQITWTQHEKWLVCVHVLFLTCNL